MARDLDPHPEPATGDPARSGLAAAPAGDVLPAFIVDSAGVATPRNMLRGDGFILHGYARPADRRRNRSMH